MTATRRVRTSILGSGSGAKPIHTPERDVFLKRYFSREPSRVYKETKYILAIDKLK